MPSIVCLQKSTYDKIDIKSLLAPVNGIKQFVKKGDRVVLKVNLLSASTSDSAVVTNPSLVKAVALSVSEVGGIPIIADSPSGPFSKRRLEKIYRISGMKQLSDEQGIDLNYDTRTTKVEIPHAKRLKKTPICKYVLDADAIISLPKLKTHSYMTLTLAIKNMFGVIPGLTKPKYHSLNIKKTAFADMLLDLYSVIPPNLTIMDGIVGMEGDGPFSGNPIDIGMLIASNDAVALDLSICNLIGIEPVGIPVLRQAKVRKLWPQQIVYPLLNPKDEKIKNFKLPSTVSYVLTGKKIPSKWPVPSDKCIRCGECVQICPRRAISLDNVKARVNYDKCIRCYCCHEVCPEKAIDLSDLK